MEKPTCVSDVLEQIAERIETQLEVNCVEMAEGQLEEILAAFAGEKLEGLLNEYVSMGILNVIPR